MFLMNLLMACFHVYDARLTTGHVAVKEIVLVCETDDAASCKVMGAAAAGTATRILWDDHYYWLTAGHVCNLSAEKGITAARAVTVTSGGDGAQAEIARLTYNLEKDLCIMPAKPGPAREIASREPGLGDPVSAIAYPGGAFSNNILPIYDGRFSGHSGDTCLTTIPVSGGSSGASVLNDDGDVVGVVSAVLRSFNHYTVTVCLPELRQFLMKAGPQAQSAEAAVVQTAPK